VQGGVVLAREPVGAEARRDCRQAGVRVLALAAVGFEQLQEAVAQLLEHEENEAGCMARAIGARECLVVGSLVALDQLLGGQVVEDGAVGAEHDVLPKAAEAAVAVAEGMDELDLVVHDASAYEQRSGAIARDEGE